MRRKRGGIRSRRGKNGQVGNETSSGGKKRGGGKLMTKLRGEVVRDGWMEMGWSRETGQRV